MSTKHYIFQETTQWADSMDANHVYVFLDKPTSRTAKAMGYVRAGTKELQRFSKPMTLDLKGRTFKELA